MKFIHIADVHLGATPDYDREWGKNRKVEIEEAFDKILEICEEKKIDLLLIAGDLFHEPPTEAQLNDLDYKLSKLSHTRTVIIAGNHDYIGENSPQDRYKFKSKTVLLPRDKTTNAYLKNINTCVTGFSYGKQEYTERVLETINPGKAGAINILLGHGGDKTHMPFRKDVIAKKGFDYVAMGHIHKPAHILKNRMAFSGSLEPIDCTETGRRGYIYGEINNGVTRISWQPINVRSYINLSLDLKPEFSNAEIMDALENQVRKLGFENIYRITLKGIVSENLNLDFSKLSGRYNIYDITDKTLCNYDEEVLLRDNANNLMGKFIKDIKDNSEINDETKRKALRYGIEALIMAGDK